MKFKALRKRIAFAIPLISLFITLLYFSSSILCQAIVFLLLLPLITVALLEYRSLAPMKDTAFVVGVSFVYLILLAFLRFSGDTTVTIHAAFLACLFPLLALEEIFFREGMKVNVAEKTLPFLYIVYPFALFLDLFLMNSSTGAIWIAYLVALAKVGDMAGYFLGQTWGRKKLASKVSPNKTVVGAYSSYVASTIVSLAMVFSPLHFSYVEAIFLGFLASLCIQGGDLFESKLKRQVQIKDSGNIPGLGGILDILDSILLLIPPFYFYWFLRYSIQG